MKKNLLFLIPVLLFSIQTSAQVGIGTNEPKSILDITSTSSGILIPRLTAQQIIDATVSTDQTGMLVYATDTTGIITATGFWYYDGTTWKNIGEGTGGGGTSQTVIFTETDGTEITVDSATEELILSEAISLSAVSSLDIEGVVNVKSINQSIVPEIRLEIVNASSTVVFEKTVRNGMITTPTVYLQDDLHINAIQTNLAAGAYTINLYASQPTCCNVDGLSFVTGGSDTISFMKITY